MIQGLSAAYMIPYPPGGPAAARKLSVPVRPLLASTMMFKHVIAVPARPPMQTTPIFKVQLLDTMIERLTRMGGKKTPAPRESSIDDRVTAARAMIHRTEMRLKPYATGLGMETGLVVNRLA
jgi:hypothetical protein